MPQTPTGWYVASRQAKLLVKLLLANQDGTQGLRVQLDAGNAWDTKRLADLLAEPIDVESVVAMPREFDAGNTNGPLQVVELLVKQGDINGLHDQADAGNLSTLKPLAELHAQRGDIEGLRLELLRGNTYAAHHLITCGCTKRGCGRTTTPLRSQRRWDDPWTRWKALPYGRVTPGYLYR